MKKKKREGSIKIDINNKIKNCFFQRTSELKILSRKLIMKKKREREREQNLTMSEKNDRKLQNL